MEKEAQKEKVKAFQAEKQQEDRKVIVQRSTDKSKQHENVEKETVKEEQKAESTSVEQPKASGLNEAQAQEKVEQSKTEQGRGERNKDVKLKSIRNPNSKGWNKGGCTSATNRRHSSAPGGKFWDYGIICRFESTIKRPFRGILGKLLW